MSAVAKIARERFLHEKKLFLNLRILLISHVVQKTLCSTDIEGNLSHAGVPLLSPVNKGS